MNLPKGQCMEGTGRIERFFSQYARTLLVDVGILVMLLILPASSHILPLPINILDPMHMVLLFGYLLSPNRTNILILACVVPFFSAWVTGHPPFLKAMLIAIELTCNMALLIVFLNKLKWPVFVSILGSILLSKVAYYSLKFVFLEMVLLSGSLVSTPLSMQMLTVLVQTVLFSLVYIRFYRHAR